MKRLLYIILSITTLFSTVANAQFIKNDTSSYQRYEVAYASQRINGLVKKDTWKAVDTEIKAIGVELGYLRGINVTSKLPLFVELGGQVTYTHTRDELKGKKYMHTFISASVPINAAYKLVFSDFDFISIVPFIGPNFKFNLIGNIQGESQGNQFDYSYLNKEQMAHRGGKASRYQFGWNYGVGINVCKLGYVGCRIQKDRKDYLEGIRPNMRFISVGINF